jgi:hypothetical protein
MKGGAKICDNCGAENSDNEDYCWLCQRRFIPPSGGGGRVQSLREIEEQRGVESQAREYARLADAAAAQRRDNAAEAQRLADTEAQMEAQRLADAEFARQLAESDSPIAVFHPPSGGGGGQRERQLYDDAEFARQLAESDSPIGGDDMNMDTNYDYGNVNKNLFEFLDIDNNGYLDHDEIIDFVRMLPTDIWGITVDYQKLDEILQRTNSVMSIDINNFPGFLEYIDNLLVEAGYYGFYTFIIEIYSPASQQLSNSFSNTNVQSAAGGGGRANVQPENLAEKRLEGMTDGETYTYSQLLNAAMPRGSIQEQTAKNDAWSGAHRIPPKDANLSVRMLQSCFTRISLSTYDISNRTKLQEIVNEMVGLMTEEVYAAFVPPPNSTLVALPAVSEQEKRRMVEASLSCVIEQKDVQQYNTGISALELFELTYRFIKNQRNPRFKNYFVSQWVREIIEAYYEEDRERGVSVRTYGSHRYPHISCTLGAVHRILNILSQTIRTVMGLESVLNPAEIEAAKQMRRTMLVNQWVQTGSATINNNQELIEYIKQEIRTQPDDRNPDEWRVSVPGSQPLTIEEHVNRIGLFGGGKLKNKTQHSKNRKNNKRTSMKKNKK